MNSLANIPPEKLPRHIAIIMDGNGRWAVQQHQQRVVGHQQGARQVKKIVTECAELREKYGAPDYLTLYSFSMENWRRPPAEVAFLMQMYIDYLRDERPTMHKHHIRFQQLGRREGLPDAVLDEVDLTLAETKTYDGLTLNLAINYGSRAEITDAVRILAEKVQRGVLSPHDITEKTIESHLYTAGMGDVDLLIRTAGEMRVSNYLLWQISYAELHVSPVLWPDFGVVDLHDSIVDFSKRNRRFGALDRTNTLPVSVETATKP